MSEETSARLQLPLLRAGQAQKELLHNEALTLVDLLAQPTVIGFAAETLPADPEPGEAWIVGTSPGGAWSGKAGCIAGWSTGGWRFVDPVEGMSAWVAEDQQIARYSRGTWSMGRLQGTSVTIDGVAVLGAQQPAISDPSDGEIIDAEARVSIAAIVAALRSHGLIAS
ncbi:DUF2793 domain-containing protein [Sphingomonas endolithica]|uniref:DUF2793 domain-containing protein n=1 Tax=Sphingomonas endolithica TaxID=2972485 RepID=UPI0021AFAE15|nr:DUF2793 domain-containing protein [Sphingomonas sp. ZFBP2030]